MPTEKKLIEQVLRDVEGDVVKAAVKFGVSYRTMIRKMHEVGIPVALRGRKKKRFRLVVGGLSKEQGELVVLSVDTDGQNNS